MPIRVYFGAPVTNQKAAVDHITVKTSVPTDGAWHWFSSTELHWRRGVLEGRHKVSLDTSLYGVDLGAAPGAGSTPIGTSNSRSATRM